MSDAPAPGPLRLVADVGGTNTRLALSRGGAVCAGTTTSFANDRFASFVDIADAYLTAQGGPEISELVIAIAGPVTTEQARLTNRDWVFDRRKLAQRFGGAQVVLLNDLAALGHAVPHLPPEALTPVCPATRDQRRNGQSLVVGIGTGFNVSPVLCQNGQVYVLGAEYGHVALPCDIAGHLSVRFGRQAAGIKSVEDCFSGRGFHLLNGLWASSGQDFAPWYAEQLGLLVSHLSLAFLPLDGLYLAGGVVRNIMHAAANRAAFSDAMNTAELRRFGISPPVWSLIDDTAALLGCADFTDLPLRQI